MLKLQPRRSLMFRAPRITMDLKKAKIYFIDGTGTPNKLEVMMDEGTMSFTSKRNIEYIKNRGLLDHTREGDEEPMDVSIDGRFSGLYSVSGEDVTPFEFLHQVGKASAYLSVDNQCEPYAVNIQVELDEPCTAITDEIMLFEKFRHEEFGGDLKAGTINISGKCNKVLPTSTRTAV